MMKAVAILFFLIAGANALLFAEVSYTGNGADSRVVTTGFSPQIVMIVSADETTNYSLMFMLGASSSTQLGQVNIGPAAGTLTGVNVGNVAGLASIAGTAINQAGSNFKIYAYA